MTTEQVPRKNRVPQSDPIRDDDAAYYEEHKDDGNYAYQGRERGGTKNVQKRDRDAMIDLESFEEEVERVYWHPQGRTDAEFWVDVRINAISSADLKEFERDMRNFRADMQRLDAIERKLADLNEGDDTYGELLEEKEKLEGIEDDLDITINRIWLVCVVDHNIERRGTKLLLNRDDLRTIPIKIFNGISGAITKAITQDAHPNSKAKQRKTSSRGGRSRR